MNSRSTIGCAVVVLALAGCSSTEENPSTTAEQPAATSAESGQSVEADSGESDFCTLYATQVAQGLANLREAEAGGVEVAESVAAELATKAPVTQSELQAVAPPEPLAWLQAMEEADAKGAAGDFSAMDGVFENLTLLTDWSIANCGPEYAPIFTEYKAIIG
ncbi:hypothetical protein BH92_04620 [Rhodococcoides fascians A21d2]|uniref:hypothetical protein n=1 Tax=Rhodococcoides fascians TaxID=1828 RepID=UPI0012D319DD|nr:hypothetical protein [Rhodococcus fascians]QIH99241.1 hypothetical protein BH92_04620 [Rhodococcus fascians A21d2]